MLATGIHAQHSTYEADVRARAIPFHGEVVASCTIANDFLTAPSRSRVIITTVISEHLTKHPLGTASTLSLTAEGIARTLILLSMSEVRHHVNRAIVDVRDARPCVLVSVHTYR